MHDLWPYDWFLFFHLFEFKCMVSLSLNANLICRTTRNAYIDKIVNMILDILYWLCLYNYPSNIQLIDLLQLHFCECVLKCFNNQSYILNHSYTTSALSFYLILHYFTEFVHVQVIHLRMTAKQVKTRVFIKCNNHAN